MDTILVTGASGNVGGAVVETLAGAGMNVRAATRVTTKIKWKERVKPVAFDYDVPGLYEAALVGSDGVFLIAPPLDFEAHRKLLPIIDRARELGVKYMVLNSAFRADTVEQSPLRIIERRLMDSGLDWAILRPNFFMENFSTGWAVPMIQSGRLSLPAADARTSFISVRDVAEVASACFREKRSGVQYDLTGGEALTYGDVARLVSGAIGSRVIYYPVSESEMRDYARIQGMSESDIDYIMRLYALVRNDQMSEITGTVREVTGKGPISFMEFARTGAYSWKARKAA